MAKSNSLVHCLPKKTLLKQGEYIIEEVVGQGGFGITYLGTDTSLLCPVAIKEYFPSGIAGRDVTEKEDLTLHVYGKDAREEYDKGMQAFISEARLLARFKEIQGIVKVHNFFRENGTAYIVMEYVDGQSVKQYIRQNGNLPASRVLEMMGQAMHVLEAVHQQQFVHRDVSVDNFMISKEGRLVLIDFGAARYTNSLDEKTRTMMCKRGFSAIEQYSTSGKQGPWTDVYGMCATMYYMLTGILPQSSTDRILRDEVVSLTEMNEIELSRKQKAAIMKGMEVDRLKRYQSMRELYQEVCEKKWTDSKLLFLEKNQEDTEKTSAIKEKQADTNVRNSSSIPVTSGTLLSKTALGRELQSMSQKRNRHRRKKLARILALAVILLVLAGVGISYWISNRSLDKEKSTRETVLDSREKIPVVSIVPSAAPTKEPMPKIAVPSVVGESKKAAIKRLKAIGLTYKVKHKETDRMLPGYVMEQSIPANQKVKKGKKIILTISKKKKVAPTQAPLTQRPPTQAPDDSGQGKDKKTSGKDNTEMAGDIDSILQ